MNNVPQKLKTQWQNEDKAGMKRVCLRADEGDCDGRLTKEHAMTFAGSQIQEEWAILDICEFHHAVNKYQDSGKLNKEKHTWIALNRATEAQLRSISKAEDKVAIRDRLNAKYGEYTGLRILGGVNKEMDEVQKLNAYCFALIKICRSTGAETMTVKQENVTYLNEQIGTWEIIIKKVTK